MNNKTVIFFFVALIVIFGIWFFVMQPKPVPTGQNPGSTATTTVETPAPDQTAGWLIYTDEAHGFSFKYPENFGANVWRPTVWPPKVTFASAGQDPLAAGCPNVQSSSGIAVTQKPGTTKSGIAYTLYSGSDVGAGQLYSDYCYVFDGGQGLSSVIDFIIQSHTACGFSGCGAYCGTQYESECTNLNRQKDIEMPLQQMIDTVNFSAPVSVVPESKTITLDDNNTTLNLSVGGTFLLKLGEGYDWNINVSDQSVVSRQVNISVIRGAQGVYAAHKVGTADLNAVGVPVCRSSVPPCAAPSINFKLHIAAK
jgi:hypothetical protein